MLTLLKIFSSYLISSKHSGKVWGTSKKKKKTHCRKYVLINLWRLHIKDMNTLSFIHVNILFFIIFVCNVRIFMFLCNHIIRQNFLYYLCWELCFSTLVTHWNHWKSFENYCYLDFPAFLLRYPDLISLESYMASRFSKDTQMILSCSQGWELLS